MINSEWTSSIKLTIKCFLHFTRLYKICFSDQREKKDTAVDHRDLKNAYRFEIEIAKLTSWIYSWVSFWLFRKIREFRWWRYFYTTKKSTYFVLSNDVQSINLASYWLRKTRTKYPKSNLRFYFRCLVNCLISSQEEFSVKCAIFIATWNRVLCMLKFASIWLQVS